MYASKMWLFDTNTKFLLVGAVRVRGQWSRALSFPPSLPPKRESGRKCQWSWHFTRCEKKNHLQRDVSTFTCQAPPSSRVNDSYTELMYHGRFALSRAFEVIANSVTTPVNENKVMEWYGITKESNRSKVVGKDHAYDKATFFVESGCLVLHPRPQRLRMSNPSQIESGQSTGPRSSLFVRTTAVRAHPREPSSQTPLGS